MFSIISVLISACMAAVVFHAGGDDNEYSHLWIISLLIMFFAYCIK